MIEFGKKLVLGVGDGLGVEGGNLCGGFGLVDCGFGLGGKEGAVALRMGVALCDGGGDARGAGVGGSWTVDRSYGVTHGLGTACAMSGESLGYLLL